MKEEIKYLTGEKVYKWNLLYAIKFTENEFKHNDLVNKIKKITQTGFENSRDKDNLAKLWKLEPLHNTWLEQYEIKGLPEFIGIKHVLETAHGMQPREYNTTQTFLPEESKIKIDNWELITLLDKNERNQEYDLINWMQKDDRKGYSDYMRFLIVPEIYEESIKSPKKWTARFEYNIRGETNENDEFAYIQTKINIYDEKISISPHNVRVILAEFDIHDDDKKNQFEFLNGSFGYTKDNNKLNTVAIKQNQTIPQSIMEKMRNEDNWNEKTISYDNLIAAKMLPNYNYENRKIDIEKTINNMFEIYKNGTYKDLLGFKAIEFSEY